ncbi:MAG: hypothetical protein QY326_09860 [Bdellovibrionota bacterium]|nr:MAG: hypothetical protein QY326_09860 [Bdellovibrionota bacterium]
MNKSLLSRKQKRLQSWTRFLSSIEAPDVRQRMERTLREFHNVLVRAWESEDATDRYDAEILDLERQLESLDEEARLRVVGRNRAA